MPPPLPSDTREILARHQTLPNSRSLFFDRFADPRTREEDRRQWFNQVAAKAAIPTKVRVWPSIVSQIAPTTVYAQLQSRLMVNMAGGVMENAGLCLDRFGMPYIPGSAVKGCARRMATQMLLDAQGEDAKADLLVKIALAFGWGDADWKPGRTRNGNPRSDFWWAMAEDAGDRSADDARDNLWSKVATAAARPLLDKLHLHTGKNSTEPWKTLPNFAGFVAFLPAWPVDPAGADLPIRAPSLGSLELDVVTCHHPEYYQDNNLTIATDTEDPIPVVFPAVAPGHVFAFHLLPLRNCDPEILALARSSLRNGLETFGIGAKTNAGYGWFSCSDELQDTVDAALRARLKAEQERIRREAEEKKRQEEQARLKAEREARKKAMEGMTPEEQEDYKLAELQRDQLLNHIAGWEKLTLHEREAIYRLLKNKNPDLWREIRDASQKGKKKEKKRWSPVVAGLFKMAKDKNEKMPK